MRSTLGFPTRGSKSTATCVSTRSIWLCCFRNLVQSRQTSGLSYSQRFSSRSTTTKHLPLSDHMLIQPSLTHRHFHARSKPLLAPHSTASQIHDSPKKHLLHPRWFNKTNNIDQQLDHLKTLRGLDPAFVFKTLRSMLYNSSQYNAATAWTIYQAMVELEVTEYMRANHYGHLLNILKYTGDTTKLLTVLDHMKAAQDQGRLVVGGRHYSQIMYGLARQGQVRTITDLLHSMDTKQLEAGWYTSLATAAKKHNVLGASRQAAGLMERAMEQGVVMEEKACAVMLSALDMEAAANFLSAMRHHMCAHFNVYIYTALISTLAQNGDAINARRLWKDMNTHGLRPTTATYAAMMEAYGRAGNLKAAIGLLKKYTYRHHGQLNKVMATSVLTNAIRHGKLDMAKALVATWEKMIDMDKMDTEFRSVVLWLKVLDDMELARDYFESLNPAEVDSIMVNQLVLGYGKTRQKQKVLDSFELHGHITSGTPHGFLVDALFKCRDVPAALSALVVMRQYAVPDDITLAMVIRGLVMNDETQLAWAVFQSMKSNGIEPNLRAYSSILKACIKGASRGAPKQQQQHTPMPTDLVKAALKINHQDDKKLGPTQAYILFRKMTGFQKPNVYTYTTLIACFAKHNLDRAMDVFSHMQSQGVDPVLETYVALLQGCAIFRNAPIALKVFQHLQDQQRVAPNGKVWHYLFKALARSRTNKAEIDKLASFIRAN